jgi:hypothetical protein
LLALHAWSLIETGELGAARSVLQRAAPIARRSGSSERVGYVQLTQARLALANSEADSALSYAETAQHIFREENARFNMAQAELVKARCFRALGIREKASTGFAAAERLFDKFGNTHQIAQTHRWIVDPGAR